MRVLNYSTWFHNTECSSTSILPPFKQRLNKCLRLLYLVKQQLDSRGSRRVGGGGGGAWDMGYTPSQPCGEHVSEDNGTASEVHQTEREKMRRKKEKRSRKRPWVSELLEPIIVTGSLGKEQPRKPPKKGSFVQAVKKGTESFVETTSFRRRRRS